MTDLPTPDPTVIQVGSLRLYPEGEPDPRSNAELLLTLGQWQYHLGRAGSDWNFDRFCREQGWTKTSLHPEDSMFTYALEKFHKVQDFAHFLNNNGSELLLRMVLGHMAEEARRRQ